MEEHIIIERSKQIWLTIIITASVLIFSIDYSMLNISFPAIAKYFNINIGSVARLPMVYLLIVTSTLLVFGKLGDIKGYKAVFISGLILFAVGAFLAGISPTINILLIARVIQSIGEAMLSPAGMAIVTSSLPDNIRGRALGVLATAQGLGIAVGSALGGLINAHFVWRGIFFINLPLIIATIVLAIKMLPSKQAKSPDSGFDYLGAVLITAALASLVYAMNMISKKGGFGIPTLICFFFSMTAFVLLIMQERRIAHPLLDLKFFKKLNFTLANVAAFFFTFLLMGFGFLAPFYLEMARGLSIAKVGALLVIPSLMLMIMAPISGRLSDKFGSSFLCAIGMGTSAVSFIMLSLISRSSGLLYIILALFLLGSGAGIFLAPNNKLVLASAPSDKQGAASGVYKIFLNTGSVFGIVLFPLVIIHASMLMAVKENVAITQIRQTPRILEFGFRGAFIFGFFVCLVALLFSILAKDNKIARQNEPA